MGRLGLNIGLQRFRKGANVNLFNFLNGVISAYPCNPMVSANHLLRSPIIVDGIYYMYEEWSDADTWYIGYRTSSNGVDWSARSSALLTKGTAGQFDDWGQADPSVIVEDGTWKMWFDATQGSFTNWISHGYATSPDGVNWTKYGAVIDRGESGEWDDFAIHHPCVLKHNGLYYMFYSGSNQAYSPTFVHHIGLATSPDGINWTKHANNPIILAGESGEWDFGYVRPSTPIFINGLWYMYYWGSSAKNTLADTTATGLATSPDLITWTKIGKVLDDAIGTYSMLRQGTNTKDKMIKMWSYDYSANSGSRYHKINTPNDYTKLDSFKIPLVASSLVGYAANYLYYHKVTIEENFTATDIRTFVLSSASYPATSGTVKCAIYSDMEGSPNTLLKTTEEKNWADIIKNVWTPFSIITPSELASGDYWIAFWSTVTFARNRPALAAGTNNWTNQSIAYGSFPATATPGSLSSFDADVILTYYPETCWKKALETEPANVYFNGVKGTKVANLVNVISEYQWTWRSGYLYVYSEQLVDIDYEISYD